MLRTIIIACALAAAAPAFAQEAPRSAQGLQVRSEVDGAVMGRVGSVERNEAGQVVSVAVSDLEAPADAPPYLMAPRRPSAPVIAVNEDGFAIAQNDGPARASRQLHAR